MEITGRVEACETKATPLIEATTDGRARGFPASENRDVIQLRWRCSIGASRPVRARRLARSDRGATEGRATTRPQRAMAAANSHQVSAALYPRRRTRTRRSVLANWTNVWAEFILGAAPRRTSRRREPLAPENHPRWLRALVVIDSGVSAARRALCSPLHRLREPVSGAGCYAVRLLRRFHGPNQFRSRWGPSISQRVVSRAGNLVRLRLHRSRRPSAFVNRPAKRVVILKRHERYEASRIGATIVPVRSRAHPRLHSLVNTRAPSSHNGGGGPAHYTQVSCTLVMQHRSTIAAWTGMPICARPRDGRFLRATQGQSASRRRCDPSVSFGRFPGLHRPILVFPVSSFPRSSKEVSRATVHSNRAQSLHCAPLADICLERRRTEQRTTRFKAGSHYALRACSSPSSALIPVNYGPQVQRRTRLPLARTRAGRHGMLSRRRRGKRHVRDRMSCKQSARDIDPSSDPHLPGYPGHDHGFYCAATRGASSAAPAAACRRQLRSSLHTPRALADGLSVAAGRPLA